MERDRWPTVELGSLLQEQRERWSPGDGASSPVRYVGLEHLIPNCPSIPSYGDPATVASQKTIFAEGDLLFGKLRPYLRKVAVAAESGVCSTDILVFRSSDPSVADPGYLYGLLSSSLVLEHAVRQSAGTRMPRVSSSDLGNVQVPLPPLAEQRRIGDLVSATAVVAAQASDVEEVGQGLYRAMLSELMPACFSAGSRPLSELGEVVLGKMLSKASKTGSDESPYLRNADVQWDALQLTGLKTMNFTSEQREKFKLRAGDVLVCEGGEVGRCAVIETDLDGIYFQKALHRVRLAPAVQPRFFLHFMRYAAITERFANLTSQLTIAHLTREKLLQLEVPVPPVEEQQRVIDILDAVRVMTTAARETGESSRRMGQAVLASLLRGEHEIPDSYDRFLDGRDGASESAETVAA